MVRVRYLRATSRRLRDGREVQPGDEIEVTPAEALVLTRRFGFAPADPGAHTALADEEAAAPRTPARWRARGYFEVRCVGCDRWLIRTAVNGRIIAQSARFRGMTGWGARPALTVIDGCLITCTCGRSAVVTVAPSRLV